MRTGTLGTTLFAFLATLAMSLPAVAQERAREGSKIQVATKFRASQIFGIAVRNTAGKDLATVKDLIVEIDSGHTRFVVLSFGGFAGFASRLCAVPWQAMTVKFGDRDLFFLYDVTEEQLKELPSFDDNTWPDLSDPAWSAGVDKHYKVEPADRKEGKNVEVASLYRASTIKNMKV